MRKFLIRSLIIFLWISLISCALYWPKWKVVQYDQNVINVFAWGDILDTDVIARFEKETGIKVTLNYYSSNEELIVKLKATGGLGYDLIIPSDYAVTTLIHEGMIKKIDRTKLDFWQTLNPALLGHFFDPNNQFSIPFAWELYGFGIDKDFFRNRSLDPSWKMIFDPKTVDYKIAMVNDPIEAVEFAAFYLYGLTKNLDAEQINKVKNTLIEQKKWVAAYASFRGDYFLATRSCPVVIASSSYIWRTMRLFDFVSYVIPKEGTFITIENLCIPALSEKDLLVYRFLNYLYRAESVASHYNTYGFFPSSLTLLDQENLDPQAAELMRSSIEDFKKFHFIQGLLPQEKVRDIWVEVKSGKF